MLVGVSSSSVLQTFFINYTLFISRLRNVSIHRKRESRMTVRWLYKMDLQGEIERKCCSCHEDLSSLFHEL